MLNLQFYALLIVFPFQAIYVPLIHANPAFLNQRKQVDRNGSIELSCLMQHLTQGYTPTLVNLTWIKTQENGASENLYTFNISRAGPSKIREPISPNAVIEDRGRIIYRPRTKEVALVLIEAQITDNGTFTCVKDYFNIVYLGVLEHRQRVELREEINYHLTVNDVPSAVYVATRGEHFSLPCPLKSWRFPDVQLIEFLFHRRIQTADGPRQFNYRLSLPHEATERYQLNVSRNYVFGSRGIFSYERDTDFTYLTIRDVADVDEGRWICNKRYLLSIAGEEAQNSRYVREEEFVYDVQIVDAETRLYKPLGQRVYMQCSITPRPGHHFGEITWHRRRQEVAKYIESSATNVAYHPSHFHSRVYLNRDTTPARFVIHRFDIRDAGPYMCTSYQRDDQIITKRLIHLGVADPLLHVKAVEGFYADLPCRLYTDNDDEEVIQVQLTKEADNQNPRVEVVRYDAFSRESVTTQGRGQRVRMLFNHEPPYFRMSNYNSSDNGNYRCKVTIQKKLRARGVRPIKYSRFTKYSLTTVNPPKDRPQIQEYIGKIGSNLSITFNQSREQTAIEANIAWENSDGVVAVRYTNMIEKPSINQTFDLDQGPSPKIRFYSNDTPQFVFTGIQPKDDNHWILRKHANYLGTAELSLLPHRVYVIGKDRNITGALHGVVRMGCDIVPTVGLKVKTVKWHSVRDGLLTPIAVVANLNQNPEKHLGFTTNDDYHVRFLNNKAELSIRNFTVESLHVEQYRCEVTYAYKENDTLFTHQYFNVTYAGLETIVTIAEGQTLHMVCDRTLPAHANCIVADSFHYYDQRGNIMARWDQHGLQMNASGWVLLGRRTIVMDRPTALKVELLNMTRELEGRLVCTTSFEYDHDGEAEIHTNEATYKIIVARKLPVRDRRFSEGWSHNPCQQGETVIGEMDLTVNPDVRTKPLYYICRPYDTSEVSALECPSTQQSLVYSSDYWDHQEFTWRCN